MTRGALLARLRRLEGPRRSRGALQRELDELERIHRPLTRDEIEALTDEQLDDALRARMGRSDGGPFQRIAELREMLATPAERLARERRRAEIEAMSDDEIDAALRAHFAQI